MRGSRLRGNDGGLTLILTFSPQGRRDLTAFAGTMGGGGGALVFEAPRQTQPSTPLPRVRWSRTWMPAFAGMTERTRLHHLCGAPTFEASHDRHNPPPLCPCALVAHLDASLRWHDGAYTAASPLRSPISKQRRGWRIAYFRSDAGSLHAHDSAGGAVLLGLDDAHDLGDGCVDSVGLVHYDSVEPCGGFHLFLRRLDAYGHLLG